MNTESLRKWTALAAIAATTAACGFIAYLEPLSFQLIAALGDMGFGYALENPDRIIARERIEDRLAAIGLEEPLKKLVKMATRDVSASNIGHLTPFDPTAPIEDAAARAALPERLTAPGLLSDPSWTPGPVTPPNREEFFTWHRAHGDNWNTKYSLLDQINVANAHKLELAWVFDSSKRPAKSAGYQRQSQTNPVFHDGVVYVVSPEWTIVALDIATGEHIWSFKAPAEIARRGIALWPGSESHGPRIFATTDGFAIAVDAKTGKRIRDFGEDGRVKIGVSRISPLVRGNEIIFATHASAELIGLDLLYGDILWTVDLHGGREKTFSGGSPWGGIAWDSVRDVVYVTTGNPRPPLYGGGRLGDNKNSDSIIAVDMATKSIKWAFQETSHDLWDMDLPSPAVLATATIEGKTFDVVMAYSKAGSIVVVDRDTGMPIYDIDYVRTPTSITPGEVTSPYQPDIQMPRRLSDMAFNPADITRVSPESQAEVAFQVEHGVWGVYAPPVLGRSLIINGLHGGGEWPGFALDPYKQRYYAPINKAPWKLRSYLQVRETGLHPKASTYGRYKKQCASCHGADRNGVYGHIREIDNTVIPSLNGLTLDADNKRYFELEYFERRHQFAGQTPEVDQDALDEQWALMADWDALQTENENLGVNYIWTRLVDHDGLPGTQPPWGQLAAISLQTGDFMWVKNIGDAVIDGTVHEDIGAWSLAGVVATAGDIVISTGTVDGKLRVLAADTGETLWTYRMDAPGTAPPTTVEWEGVQYIVVTATGGGRTPIGSERSLFYAFRLPAAQR